LFVLRARTRSLRRCEGEPLCRIERLKRRGCATSQSPRGGAIRLLPSPSYSQAAEAAALANNARARHGPHDRYRGGRELPLLAGEVVYEIDAGAVVLADIVVVEGFLTETAIGDRRVNRRGGVGEAEEWCAVDLAERAIVDLNARVGSDHLQVEHEPAGLG
jgi:hypothetical protein